MSLPAPLVRAWSDIQLNFDALAKLLPLATLLPVKSYSFHATGTGSVGVPGSTTTKYPFANENYDPDGVYDLANTQFVAPLAGVYEFTAAVAIPSFGAAGVRWIWRLHVNGAIQRMLAIDWATAAWSNDKVLVGSSGRILLSAGDTVDCRVNHNNAAALNVGSAVQTSNFFAGGRVFGS